MAACICIACYMSVIDAFLQDMCIIFLLHSYYDAYVMLSCKFLQKYQLIKIYLTKWRRSFWLRFVTKRDFDWNRLNSKQVTELKHVSVVRLSEITPLVLIKVLCSDPCMLCVKFEMCRSWYFWCFIQGCLSCVLSKLMSECRWHLSLTIFVLLTAAHIVGGALRNGDVHLLVFVCHQRQHCTYIRHRVPLWVMMKLSIARVTISPVWVL